MIEDPIYFKNTIKSNSGYVIEIRDLIEVCQGGPHIGRLYVNGELHFPREFFGGPIIETGNILFLTRRIKKIFFNGFSLCKVDIPSVTWKDTAIKSQLIWPKRIESGFLYYLDDLDEETGELKYRI